MKQNLILMVTLLILVACAKDQKDHASTQQAQEPSQPSYIEFIPTWSSQIEATEAWKNKTEIWEQFRQQFPYHIQTIAVQFFPKDSSYCLLLTEPSPLLVKEDFTRFFSFYNSKIDYKEKQVGFDGWTKDLVVSIADIPPNIFRDMIFKLNTLLFGSNYKSDYYFELPIKAKYLPFQSDNLNYQVTMQELKSWFITSNEYFMESGSESGAALTLPDLLNAGKEGVFLSATPGFIVWVIRQGGDIGYKKDDIHKFALDSDLIIGGIANDNYLAIVARERQKSIAELSPLRTETILQLAAADKEELAQSYERMMFLAGKMPGGQDWAPIYLSDELINTEYGSLLNLTDQMLKSWSCNGAIKYDHWGHRKPRRWAFTGTGIMDELNVSTITFNWNTKGAAYAVKDTDFEIIALNRTGSLPVSYFPEGMENDVSEEKLKKAEEKGYDFFSNLNNPDLVRVVQYAALYQMFRAYNIRSSQYYNNGYKPTRSPLVKIYLEVYNKINRLTEEEIRALSAKMSREYAKKYIEYQLSFASQWPEEFSYTKEEIADFTEEFAEELQLEIPILIEQYKQLYNELRKYKSSRELAMISADSREIPLYTDQDLYVYQELNRLNRLARDLSYYGLYRNLGISLENVRDQYSNGFSESEGQWIKTPSLVVSWQKDSTFATGGHNLNSRIVPFKVDKNLKPGEYKVAEWNGKKTVYLAESDVGRISPKMLRQVEDAGAGMHKLGKIKATGPPRPRAQVVSNKVRPERGLSEGHIEARKTASGIEVNGKKLNSQSEFVQEVTTLLQQSKGKKIEYRLEGFSRDEALVTLKSAEVKMAFREGVVKSDGLFNRINRQSFDFSNATAKVIENQAKVVIDIPAKPGFFGRMRITVSRLSKALMEKIKTIAERVFKRCETQDLNFKDEFLKELRNEGINPDDVFFQLEFQDVIISWLLNLPELENQQRQRDFYDNLC